MLSHTLPALEWSHIQDSCQPIGENGWHADAFYHNELKLVVKKMRKPCSQLISREIENLQYLSSFMDVKCYHRVQDEGQLCGFTLKYIRGQKWDHILKNQNNIFSIHAVARVMFVVKLAKIMRCLQDHKFCHGDLHLQNILIDIDNQSPTNINFQISVIDFGNGFVFQQGKLVSEGLTGWAVIVPFEAESLGKKDYDPIGINAYQLGRNALQILLLERHEEAQNLQYSPNAQLQALKKSQQYPKQLFYFIEGLLNEKPTERNAFLSTEIDDLVEKTREIARKSHFNQSTNDYLN